VIIVIEGNEWLVLLVCVPTVAEGEEKGGGPSSVFIKGISIIFLLLPRRNPFVSKEEKARGMRCQYAQRHNE